MGSLGIRLTSLAFPIPHQAINTDPRYLNEKFRLQQARRYLNFYNGHEGLSNEEHILIPSLCDYEIYKLQAMDALTRVEKILFKVFNPFFSNLPTSNKGTARFLGVSAVVIGAICMSARTRNDKLVALSAISYTVFLCNELYFKKLYF